MANLVATSAGSTTALGELIAHGAQKYSELAVRCLVSILRRYFRKELRDIETAQGLPSGTLPDPIAIVGARVNHDNRSPLIGVFVEGEDPIPPAGQRFDLWATELSVAISMVMPAEMGASLERLERQMNRYKSALIQLIANHPTLDQRVTAAVLLPGSGLAQLGDRSLTRFVAVMPIEVRTHTRRGTV